MSSNSRFGDLALLLARLAAAAAVETQAVAKTRQALLAAHEAGASLAQLGEALGIPRQTVRWRIRTAQRMRDTNEKGVRS